MRCDYCGEERVLGVLECWPEERAFMLETCCEAYHEGMVEEFNDPTALGDRGWRRAFAAWFQGETGLQVRRPFVSQSEVAIRLDFGLDFVDVTCAEAKAFVREHHRHNPPPVSWRWGLGVRNGGDLVAVAMVGRPVARKLDANEVVEVTRLCVNPDLDPELVWNACSMLYAEAAREAERRGFKRIITYTLESEPATALKAVGWTPAAKTRGGTWNRPSRARQDKAPTCPKIRWERELAPTAAAVEERRAA